MSRYDKRKLTDKGVISVNLRKIMKRRGVHLRMLSRMIGGMWPDEPSSTSTLSYLINGKKEPLASTLWKVVSILEVPADTLLDPDSRFSWIKRFPKSKLDKWRGGRKVG